MCIVPFTEICLWVSIFLVSRLRWICSFWLLSPHTELALSRWKVSEIIGCSSSKHIESVLTKSILQAIYVAVCEHPFTKTCLLNIFFLQACRFCHICLSLCTLSTQQVIPNFLSATTNKKLVIIVLLGMLYTSNADLNIIR